MSLDFEKLLPVLIGTIIAVVLAGIGVYWARSFGKWSLRGESSAEPFTLQDLREMLKRGEITQSEFETMKAGMIGSIRTLKRSTKDKGDGKRPQIDIEE